MSGQKRDCKSCRHYGTNIGCLRLVGCSTSDNEHWEQRWDAAKTRQEPAGAPSAGAAIPAQPEPVPNANPAAWNLVMRDMLARDEMGRQKYGVRLQPGNGRDTLRDAYEEALDLAVYLRTAIYERDGK